MTLLVKVLYSQLFLRVFLNARNSSFKLNSRLKKSIELLRFRILILKNFKKF